MNKKKHRESQGTINFLIVASLIITPVFIYLGIEYIYDEYRLQEYGQVVYADVTATQLGEEGDTSRYSIKYSFVAETGGAKYTHSDGLGRKDIWATVTHSDWQRARNRGRIEVVYLPANPWINRPYQDATQRYQDGVATIVFALLFPLLLLIMYRHGT